MVKGVFRALRVRNYRLYASGQLVSATGTWMARVTQDWLVYHILTHDSSFALGVVTALQFLPSLLFGMHGGLLADRYAKRRVLVVTQAVMGSLSVVTGALIATHAIALWSISVIALLFGVASAIDMPVRQAFVVEMVGRDMLQNAVSLNSATFNGARLLGPAAAGLMIVAVGTAPAFFVNAFSYLAVIVALLAMRVGELRSTPRVARSGGQLREGLAYVRRHADVLLPILLVAFVATFGLNFQITNALVARVAFHRGAGAYGMLSAAQALGALGGALLSARRSRRPTLRSVFVLAGTFGLVEAALGLVPTYPLFLASLVVVGAVSIMLLTSCNSSVQLGTVPHMQGRVMAIYTTVFTGGAPLGSLLIGWLGGAAGPRVTLVAEGLISVTAALGLALIHLRRTGVRLPEFGPALLRGHLTDAEIAAGTLADVRSR